MMHKVQVGSIVRMRPDNDDLSDVAGIVGTITEIDVEGSGEHTIHANAWQFTHYVTYEHCPIVQETPVEVRAIGACSHEFTVIG